MDAETISNFLADLEPENTGVRHSRISDGRPIGIWVNDEIHARYNRIQKVTHRRFGKKMRQILIFALEAAEKKLNTAA